MSSRAVFFMLFKEQPSVERILALESAVQNRVGTNICSNKGSQYNRIVPLEDADLCASINDDGSLQFRDEQRMSPLLGVRPLQDRLFMLDPLTRYWEAGYPEGPAAEYVVAMLTFLNQIDIEGVWYARESYADGAMVTAITKGRVLDMLDEFIHVGRAN